MSGSRLEAFLALIYVDQTAREKFLADPRGEATRAGLTAPEIEELVNIDREGPGIFCPQLRTQEST